MCQFPFTYNGKVYDKCTTEDNWGVPWCCTSSVIPCDEDDAPWINCKESKICKFPTTYKGKSYDSCTYVDNDGKAWCNTTDGSWGNCDENTCQVDKNPSEHYLILIFNHA